MNKMTNQKIMKKLRSPIVSDQEEAFVCLYDLLFSRTVTYIQKNNGTKEDARDIFQEALFVFYKMVQQDRVEKDTNPSAYIFIVCRNLWLKKLQKSKRETPLIEQEHDVLIPPEQLDLLRKAEQHELLEEALQAMGPACQAVLIGYYYHELKMEEIVKNLGYSNTQVARNKKYKCMKKLKQLILNSNYFRSFFKEN